MCITDRSPSRAGSHAVVLARLLLLAALAGLGAKVSAHPVAQGAMDVEVAPDRIVLRAFVSQEEVLVAAAYGGDGAAAYAVKQERHAEYLAAHVTVSADARTLHGNVRRDGSAYVLDYVVPAGSPSRIRISENVLNEFDYAPGNRWEASYIARVRDGDRTLLEALLTPRDPLEFKPTPDAGGGEGWSRLAGAYVRHGILHILTGYDHLLFAAALLLAVKTFWELVKVVSAFTLAHTITLALAALGFVHVPASIVEPMIAASIVFVALQNVIAPEHSHGWSRLLVAFGFGLFHGLGFAGGLVEAMASMPLIHTGVAIAAFSVGVEIGHQIVILPLFALLKFQRAHRRAQPRLVVRYGSAAISCAGIVYFVAALGAGGA